MTAMRAPGMPLVLAAGLLLGGCAQNPVPPASPAPKPVRARGLQVDAASVPVDKVPFRTGISSATVEKLAKEQGCTQGESGEGAGLLTQPGPVEIYRMQCADGRVFMARCELRQCARL
jgi:hypothetical protein